MAKISRVGTIRATGEVADLLFKTTTEPRVKNDAAVERARIMQILHEKIYELKSDPAWVKSPTEAVIVGAYEELIKEIGRGGK